VISFYLAEVRDHATDVGAEALSDGQPRGAYVYITVFYRGETGSLTGTRRLTTTLETLSVALLDLPLQVKGEESVHAVPSVQQNMPRGLYTSGIRRETYVGEPVHFSLFESFVDEPHGLQVTGNRGHRMCRAETPKGDPGDRYDELGERVSIPADLPASDTVICQSP